MSERFKNILIAKPSSLGDIVLALPALRALRMSFPEAKISWLVRPEFAQLIENHPHLNEIITFDRKLLGKAWFHPGAFGALISLIRKLRRSKFDVIFDFQGLFSEQLRWPGFPAVKHASEWRTPGNSPPSSIRTKCPRISNVFTW